MSISSNWQAATSPRLHNPVDLHPAKFPDTLKNVAKSPKTQVLFVCIGNACRSQMGEAIARKEAADVIQPFSAGLHPLGMIPELTLKTLEANGYSGEGLASKALRDFSGAGIDLVVDMSGLGRQDAFADFQNVEEWEVTDPYGGNAATYQKIFLEIQDKVMAMAQLLRETKRANEENQ